MKQHACEKSMGKEMNGKLKKKHFETKIEKQYTKTYGMEQKPF